MPTSAKIIAASSVTRALSVIGDRWTLLILRDAFKGAHRFEEFRTLSGAARSTLTSRLNGLVENGLLERVRYSESPPRFEYRLTDRGRSLYGVTLVIWRWEHRWGPSGAGIPSYLRHNVCGHAMKPDLTCSGCKQHIELKDTSYEVVAGSGRVKASKPRFRRLSSITVDNHRGANDAFVRTTDILGDRWMPLVLSAAFFGLRRFDEIQSGLEIATNILTHRLNTLVAHDILKRCQYSDRPPRFEYRLTEKGRDLYPHALLLMQWGDRWLAPSGGPNLRIVHKTCGTYLGALVTCSHCHAAIDPHDVTFPPSIARKPKTEATS
ncbi:helix-turn-helix domain-containing protein [Povalibacter sp.]|uniref:winged helix-turn-helix transcriptional regulator n=1 Tax=Povalibacter sp. TaxID=1962978 RepID=UPI002F3F2EA3